MVVDLMKRGHFPLWMDWQEDWKRQEGWRQWKVAERNQQVVQVQGLFEMLEGLVRLVLCLMVVQF